MAAQTVTEELAKDELTPQHVQQRVDDWVGRIEALYRNIESWLPNNWAARRGDPVPMHEELMRKAGLKKRDMPTLELLQNGVVRAKLRPYGLWIIGTNGRVDLFKGQEHFFLHDHAGMFEPADWHVAASTARRDSKSFDCDRLRVLLAA